MNSENRPDIILCHLHVDFQDYVCFRYNIVFRNYRIILRQAPKDVVKDNLLSIIMNYFLLNLVVLI